jgi:peptide/nickel transport system substrate-binding protein
LATSENSTLKIDIVHEDPFGNYDYSYNVDMVANEPAYFEMPPSYYPSTAVIGQVSDQGNTILASNITTIGARQYWDYIRSEPASDAIFRQIAVQGSSVPQTLQPTETSSPISNAEPQQPSGCLIATAAFGSELTPQVQFLRSFRDNRILSTASGSSFMNVFNAWYYSFSPQVADYERQQPWLQQTVKVSIYPLLGILQTAEKVYAVLPGEFGSVSAGIVASSLLGAVYVSPIALSIKQVRRTKVRPLIPALVLGVGSATVAVSVLLGNPQAMMASTSLLVISTIVISAIVVARTASLSIARLRSRL